MSARGRHVALLALLLLAAPVSASEGRERGQADARAEAASTLLREQLGSRVEAALARRDARPLRFEVVEISHWQLQPREAEFVLWGLLHVADAPARMLRVESRIDRSSLELDALQLQSFDELQARQTPLPR